MLIKNEILTQSAGTPASADHSQNEQPQCRTGESLSLPSAAPSRAGQPPPPPAICQLDRQTLASQSSSLSLSSSPSLSSSTSPSSTTTASSSSSLSSQSDGPPNNRHGNCHGDTDGLLAAASATPTSRAPQHEQAGHQADHESLAKRQRPVTTAPVVRENGHGSGVAPTPATTTTATNECKPATVDSMDNSDYDKDFITLIHFNDCYNIEPGPESSGAAGFLTAINQFRHLNPIILFSGDILSPSFMSTFTKGEQMIPVLNDIGVHCAVFGNHEFDYGVDNLIEFTRRTSFPWLLSNVIDKETSNQLGDGLVYHIIERQGLKFGLIGLIEEEWLSTLSTLDSSDVIYEDFVKKGQELARWLKRDLGHQVDFVIALTHFRTPNDIRLADSVPEIDLILGGHDHDYEIIKRPNCYVVKSGTDFREFSLIKLKLNAQYFQSKKSIVKDGGESSETTASTTTSGSTTAALSASSSGTTLTTTPINNNGQTKTSETPLNGKQQQDHGQSVKPISEIAIKRIECLSCPPDEGLKQKLDKFVTSIDEKMGKVLGQFNCELDGRFSSIRKFETNLGNFVCDIMLASTYADLAILNSGTLRSDRVHPKGDFTMRDLFNILGYIDPIAVLQATGYHVWQALENGVSQWPKLEGRFPQVSGCSFAFDPSKPPLKRIDPKDILIGEEPLDLKKSYRLTTKAYLASGKDGYDILKECKILVPGDESPDLTTSILNHFEAINILKSNRRTHHRQSLICLSRSSIRKLLDQTTTEEQRDDEEDDETSQINNNNNNDLSSTALAAASTKQTDNGRQATLNDDTNNNNLSSTTTTPLAAAAAATSERLIDCSSIDERLLKLRGGASLDVVGGAGAGSVAIDDEHIDDRKTDYETSRAATSTQKDGDAILGYLEGKQQHAQQQQLQYVAMGPSASSPLVGSAAPTPTLGNMLKASVDAHDMSGSCGGCGTAMATPPSVMRPRREMRQPRTKRMMSLYEMECEQCKLEPKVEGRIKILGVNYWPQ